MEAVRIQYQIFRCKARKEFAGKVNGLRPCSFTITVAQFGIIGNFAETKKMKLNIIPVKWTDEGVAMLDQRLLPTEETWLMLKTYDEVAAGIKDMVVRGAPAIGVSAAYGIALGAKNFVGTNVDDLEDELEFICDVLGKTRPTAVNLFWAIDRMNRTFQKPKRKGSRSARSNRSCSTTPRPSTKKISNRSG